MLVLTTMFINVSNNLPQTAYIKMVDLWLIFNFVLALASVLPHTYMDTLRTEAQEANGEERTINHHGRKIKVGGGTSSHSHDSNDFTTGKSIQVQPAPVEDRQAALVQRNEILELKVRKYLHQYQNLFLSRPEGNCTILSARIRRTRKRGN